MRLEHLGEALQLAATRQQLCDKLQALDNAGAVQVSIDSDLMSAVLVDVLLPVIHGELSRHIAAVDGKLAGLGVEV